MRGKLDSVTRSGDTTTFTISTNDNVGEIPDKLNGADIDFEIRKHSDKRSHEANAYMWELCTKLARAISTDGIVYTKEDVYREAIQRVGTFKDYPMMYAGCDELRRLWSSQGVGWITEIVDYLPDDKGLLIRCYYGTSTYNKAEMKAVIDCLIQDCEAVGVDHRTPEEIANMISLWKNEPR